MNTIHHIWIKTILLMAGLWLASGAVHAQEGAGPCPPGIGYYGTHDGIPSCGQPGNSQAPAAHYEDRWGAIVTDFSHGSVGMINNAATQSSAEQLATADCQAKGGVTCKVEIAYANECAALVAGDKTHITRAGATVEAAIQAGVKKCSEEDNHCRAYFSGCSPTVQIQ
ncbi:DUF4189 domain-containing protein [Rhodanobacter sp. A1T4]|uniref:DUF4189 domain-containing protein n=1 Tax=Rhodanobacter sp. A1T4 TaxID=2723087 RepID=UPI0016173E64|nr:DUF4189 domain-containing protein [Rhodanobacter sp. A1T4]MBB6246984.1 hypothetical protein [Rhodanobacter sp. A1T4]